ncbi:MAG: hypothetical protein AAF743_05030 [Planctomycetota bacterium]
MGQLLLLLTLMGSPQAQASKRALAFAKSAGPDSALALMRVAEMAGRVGDEAIVAAVVDHFVERPEQLRGLHRADRPMFVEPALAALAVGDTDRHAAMLEVVEEHLRYSREGLTWRSVAGAWGASGNVDRAVAAAERADDPEDTAWGLRLGGALAELHGHPDAAERLLELAERADGDVEDPRRRDRQPVYAFHAFLDAGAFDEAEPLLDGLRDGYWHVNYGVDLAEQRLYAGDRAGFDQTMAKAVDVAIAIANAAGDDSRIFPLVKVSRLYSDTSNLQRALELAATAEASSRKLRARDMASALLRVAGAYGAGGDAESARRLVAEAMALHGHTDVERLPMWEHGYSEAAEGLAHGGFVDDARAILERLGEKRTGYQGYAALATHFASIGDIDAAADALADVRWGRKFRHEAARRVGWSLVNAGHTDKLDALAQQLRTDADRAHLWLGVLDHTIAGRPQPSVYSP